MLGQFPSDAVTGSRRFLVEPAGLAGVPILARGTNALFSGVVLHRELDCDEC